MSAARSEVGKLNQRANQFAQAFQTAYPRVQSTLNQQILPTEQSLLEALRFSFPQIAQLQRTEDLKTAADQLPIFEKDIRMQEGLSREFDPEFYNMRGQLSSGLSQLLQPGLTGGERTEIERALGSRALSTGTQFTPSQTETVSQATNFGEAARNKFASALGQVTQALPALKTSLASPLRQLPQALKAPQQAPGQQSLAAGLQQQEQIGGAQRLGITGRITGKSDLERAVAIGQGLSEIHSNTAPQVDY